MPVDDELWLADRPHVELGGNQPWLLDDPEQCWAVVAGTMDVFAVHVGADGEVGARHHVAQAQAGQLLTGTQVTPGAPGAAGMALLAVPAGTVSIVEITAAEVGALLADPLERLLTTLALTEWAEALSATLPRTRPPFTGIAALPGADLVLGAGTALTVRGGAACVRVRRGRALLASDPAMPLTSERGWVPLTGDTWLMPETDVTCDVMHLAQAVREAPGLTPMTGLNELLLQSIADHQQAEVQAEADRLRRRDTRTRQAFSRTIARQARVLDHDYDEAEGGEESALLDACRVIGRRLGVRFRPSPTSWRGKGYDPVSAIARASRVRYREVKLEGEWWRSDSGPLLALTSNGSPLALLPRTRRRYRAYSPESARPVAVDSELAATLRPTAIMFYRPLPERPLRGRDILAYVLHGSHRDLVAVGLLSLLAAVIGLALPVFTGLVFGSTIPAGNRLGLAEIAVMLLMLAVTLGVFSYTRGVSMVRLQTRIDNELQAAIWDRLLALPPSFFRGFTAGDLAVRVTTINQVSAIFFNSVLGSLLGAVFSLVNLLLILTYSASLALLALLLLIVAVAVSLAVALLQLRVRRRVFEIQGQLSGVVLQLVSAIAKLRDTGSEERAFMRWSDGFVEMTRATVKAARIGIVSLAFNAAFPVLCSAATFAVFYFFLGDDLQTGRFMAYTAAFTQLLAGLLAMSIALVSLTNAAPLYERTKPILEAAPEVDDTKADPGELRGHIEMSHVTFSYDPEATPTIHDLSLEVRPGEFVALVGPSGAGKSTLFRLLLGFNEPDSGEIRYDEQDLRTLDLGALRRQISTVLQNGRVFSGTIQLNISGAAQLTQDEIWEAARAAGLAEDIEAMPMGMFTYVAEGGVTLSGGQRQRLLIARALSTKPAILFFDEATSSLDNRTQAIVMESLEALRATRLVIAQRLSTVRAADRIYVLENGSMVEHGTYDELMSRPGLFRRLAERQLV